MLIVLLAFAYVAPAWLLAHVAYRRVEPHSRRAAVASAALAVVASALLSWQVSNVLALSIALLVCAVDALPRSDALPWWQSPLTWLGAALWYGAAYEFWRHASEQYSGIPLFGVGGLGLLLLSLDLALRKADVSQLRARITESVLTVLVLAGCVAFWISSRP